MPRMRARLIVSLFFLLISLGQAYPFSYAYALGQEDTCSCHRAGHECMHGCPSKGGHCCHHGEGNSKDPTPRFSKLPCGGKTTQEVLSFRGDPFLPAQPGIPVATRRGADFPDFACYHPSLLLSPETPPPRTVRRPS